MKRLLRIATLLSIFGVFLVPLYPVSNTLSKLTWLACLSGAWLGMLILMWKHRISRVSILILPVLLAIPFIVPSGEIDAGKIRNDYAARMSRLEGTKYFWGGESSRGIDCSGLPRKALRDALFAYGVKNFNSRALRSSVEQWWFDTSAKALGEGYRDFTTPVGNTGTIEKMDYSQLTPGDLAVTDDGVHVLAYLGNGKWIQADPSVGKVVTLDGRKDANGWFSVPVTTHRWKLTR